MELYEFCDHFGSVSDVEKRRNGWQAGLKQDKCSPFISVISSSGAALVPAEHQENECQNH